MTLSSSSPVVIDAHAHVWDITRTPQPWMTASEADVIGRSFSLDELTSIARAASVDRTVLVQSANSTVETEQLLAHAGRSPLVAGVVGWVDLASPDVAADIHRMRSMPGGVGLRGLRHVTTGTSASAWLLRQDVRRGIAAAFAESLAVDVLALPTDLDAVAQVAERLPGAFVLDHLAKPDVGSRPDPAWLRGLERLRDLDHVHVKISGLWSALGRRPDVDPRPFLDAALDVFGPHRLLFATDWPVCSLSSDYARVVAASRAWSRSLGRESDIAVMGANATRVYALG